jgi:hypothetical protein
LAISGKVFGIIRFGSGYRPFLGLPDERLSLWLEYLGWFGTVIAVRFWQRRADNFGRYRKPKSVIS